jgi:lysozyme
LSWYREAEQLKVDEGLRLKPYHDSMGILSIGYGRNLEAKGIREDEAEAMLANDVWEAYEECRKHIPVFKYLNEDRQGVLINMMFNMGWGTLKKFKKFLEALEGMNFEEAAVQMKDSVWFTQVGPRAERLIARMIGVT